MRHGSGSAHLLSPCDPCLGQQRHLDRPVRALVFSAGAFDAELLAWSSAHDCFLDSAGLGARFRPRRTESLVSSVFYFRHGNGSHHGQSTPACGDEGGEEGGAGPQARAGKVRVIGILEKTRYPGMANLPTVGETVPGFEKPPSWFG